MIQVLSQSDAERLDANTIQSNHLSEAKLMDNAGRKIAQFIMENIPDPFNQKFVVLAGPGNNGGDGIICFYYLKDYGADTCLVILQKDQKHKEILDKYSISNESLEEYSSEFIFKPNSWYLDGIFGIGLKRKVEGKYSEIITKLRDCPNVISIDIPSGIYCDNGTEAGISVKAEYTLTMGYPKLGHYFNNGLENSGFTEAMDIEFKPLTNDDDFTPLITKEDVQTLIPRNCNNSHKYTRGKLVSVAGSKGYTGACILAVQGAIKMGAGVVRTIVPQSLNSIFETSLTESITVPLQEYRDGCFSEENVEAILDEIQWADGVLFGPGLQRDPESSHLMGQVLKQIERSIILDASGFQPLIDQLIDMADLPTETILTPHYAEFSQIFGFNTNQVQCDPINAVKSIVAKLEGRVLILKGPTNIIVSSIGELFLMNRGLPSLATAGTGDVLAGILSGLMVQGLSIDQAAQLGAYLHGECAHLYAELLADNGLTAVDMLSIIPMAMESIQDVP